MKLVDKPTQMTPEVFAMLETRHSVEQRGNFSPFGRLLSLNTEHGIIQFPAKDGEGCGPDLAHATENTNCLLILGEWRGLPPLRVNSSKPCPKCRHACDVCDGGGKAQCNGFQCGGRGWIPGNFLPCPGPGCTKDTGRFKSDCVTCNGSGQIVEERTCPMCLGTKLMKCPRCKGTGQFSTGKVGGTTNWNDKACKSCDGIGLEGEAQKQDVKKFTSAVLIKKRTGKDAHQALLVLGAIGSFTVLDYESSRVRTFDVMPDEKGDLMVLLVPRGHLQKPQKAYLVGGVVRERELLAAAGM